MHPELIAHRGYALRYPENTVLAVEAALVAGACHVEIDVQLSADQLPMVFHDRSLTRMTGGAGAIHDYPAANLRELRASDVARFGARYMDVRLATLAEIVALFRHWPGATLFVEIKRVALERFGIDAVYRAVERELVPIRDRAPLISFDFDVLLTARWCGWPRLGVVLERWAERDHPFVREIAPEFVFCDQRDLPRGGQLRFGRARGVAYEVDDPARARALAARGIALIETFAIKEMLAALQDGTDG